MKTTVDQVQLSDLGSWFGKMYPELLAQTKAQTSEPSCKKRSALSAKKPPLFLCLQTDGRQPDASLTWKDIGVLRGAYSTLSFGESPSIAVESHLSQILEEHPLPKYSLSAKACQGILRRAGRRGKELPEVLRIALERERGKARKGGNARNTGQVQRHGQVSALGKQAVAKMLEEDESG